MIIKVLLIVAVLASAILLLRQDGTTTHLAMRRLAAIGLGLLGVAAVLSPDTVDRVANWVGVGRGADLVLYALVVAFLLSSVVAHQRMHRIERQVADLTRAMALSERLTNEDSAPAAND